MHWDPLIRSQVDRGAAGNGAARQFGKRDRSYPGRERGGGEMSPSALLDVHPTGDIIVSAP
jgi:hypothetical protein